MSAGLLAAATVAGADAFSAPSMEIFSVDLSADGQEMATMGTVPIDDEFRIFTTANMGRINSNKLSAAFLNRVIRVWLPPLDGELLEQYDDNEVFGKRLERAQSTEAFQIISAKMARTLC